MVLGSETGAPTVVVWEHPRPGPREGLPGCQGGNFTCWVEYIFMCQFQNRTIKTMLESRAVACSAGGVSPDHNTIQRHL